MSAQTLSPIGEQANDITLLLQSWRSGDRNAENALFSQVFPSLQSLAKDLLKRDHLGHSLQPEELVNEVYIHLVAAKHRDWQNRKQFFALAARAMRRYMIDYARRRPDAGSVALQGIQEFLPADSANLELAISVDRLLDELAATKPEWSELVELKCFLGLKDEEAAEALGMKPRALQTSWQEIKRWLFDHLYDRRRGREA